MKKMKIGLYLAGLIVVGLGAAMAITNPDRATYDVYASQALAQYIQTEECPKASKTVQELCNLLGKEEVQTQLAKLIAANTQRQNFLFFSLYQTDLSPKELLPAFVSGLISLPSYHFETGAAFNNFYTYKAEKQKP